MALSRPLLLQFRSQQPLLAPTNFNFNFNFNFFSDLAESRAPDAPCPASLNLLLRSNISVPVLKPKVVVAGPVKCFARSTKLLRRMKQAETISFGDEPPLRKLTVLSLGELRPPTSAILSLSEFVNRFTKFVLISSFSPLNYIKHFSITGSMN